MTPGQFLDLTYRQFDALALELERWLKQQTSSGEPNTQFG
jgi:hypothetical protein